MFNLRNWKYTTHKSVIHALVGAAGFIMIMMPLLHHEIQADGQEPDAGEEIVEEETEAELQVNIPVPVREPQITPELIEVNTVQESVLESSDDEDEVREEVFAGEALQKLQDHEFIIRREEIYNETLDYDIEYVDNPVWTSAREELLQQGESGELQVTVLVTYRGTEEESRVILEETVIQEPVSEIIERGTKDPAEYIKPLDEGVFTSGFGMRWGRMHKGLDWGVETGTRVNAARDGVVTVSGEISGYGNAVYISHEDGAETRYAHLSECLVEVGQKVKQGDQIALSGNTGRSTGPHLHFEIRLEGEPINPWDMLEK